MIPSPRVNTAQSSVPITVPAPIGGLNGRDPLADMGPTDAYLMDNYFPNTAYVQGRRGSVRYSNSSLGGPVGALEVYSGATGDKMLAWANGNIWDVSTSVQVSLASGLVSNLPIVTMFSNAADNAQHMIIVTGQDQPRHYDGAAVSTLTMTGMTGSQNTLNFVFAFKSRLYFGQRDKLGFYYLPVGAIQGALSYFDLGQVSRLGGYLLAIASFSDDSGKTPNDYIAFITNKGEIIVYMGYDPSNAATWELVGRYYTAQPIGNRCTVNYGSELVILTLDGALQFSDIRRSGDDKARGVAGSQYTALTSKLGTFLSDYNENSNVQGWQGLQYSSQDGAGWLVLNVPITSAASGGYYHYVMNTKTNAWCRFTNWNGMCFVVYGKKLYFGRYDGYVMQGDVGLLDDGDDIRCDVKQAYNYFDDGSGMSFLGKHFQWASLLVSSDGTPPLSGKFNVDFFEDRPDYVSSLNPSLGAEWDVAFWDEGVWGIDEFTQRVIITLNKAGVAGALWLRASLRGVTFKWYATQYVMQKTRSLLP